MKIKNILEACDDALGMLKWELQNQREKNAELTKKIDLLEKDYNQLADEYKRLADKIVTVTEAEEGEVNA